MNRIKELRAEKNITQEVLAKLLGLEIAGISKLETGRVPLKDDYIIKLSNYFKVSTDYLLGKTNERNSVKDVLGLEQLGFNINDYVPPTPKQKEQIKTIVETILQDNKKNNK